MTNVRPEIAAGMVVERVLRGLIEQQRRDLRRWACRTPIIHPSRCACNQ